jgi:glutathione S-transferase
MTGERLILHEYALSGNCYKIRLTAAHCAVPLERRQYDIMAGETRTAEFLGRINPDGRIPVLQIGERFLPESNAACCWLADGSALIPAGRMERAEMMRWLFWEQYSHEPNIATLRFWRRWVGEDRLSETQRIQVTSKEAAGRAALAIMDRHLARQDWMTGTCFSIADIALYAYTHVADAGGFALDDHPAIARWMSRVAAMPGHVLITD